MHNKDWKYVRAVILTTLTVLETVSLSMSTNIKTLAQEYPTGTPFYIEDAINNSLIVKPPVICRILASRNMLRWKCPVQKQENNSEKVPANVSREGVTKKQDNPQIQRRNR